MCWSCYAFWHSGKTHPNYRKAWGNKKNMKPFCQYNKLGDLITTWKCITEMENCTGMKASNVRKALCGELKTAYKFIWKYI